MICHAAQRAACACLMLRENCCALTAGGSAVLPHLPRQCHDAHAQRRGSAARDGLCAARYASAQNMGYYKSIGSRSQSPLPPMARCP